MIECGCGLSLGARECGKYAQYKVHKGKRQKQSKKYKLCVQVADSLANMSRIRWTFTIKVMTIGWRFVYSDQQILTGRVHTLHTCPPGGSSAAPVSPRAILQAREPELRPPSSPALGFLGEINSTSSTSSLSVSSFVLAPLKACCLCEASPVGRWLTSKPRSNALQRVETYGGVEAVDSVPQPGLLNSGSPG